MAQVLRHSTSHVVLLFSQGEVRPAISSLNEELIELASLPAGIQQLTTTIENDGTISQITPPAVNQTDSAAEILKEAKAHATRLSLLCNPVWLHSSTGASRNIQAQNNQLTETSQRWSNTLYWIFCPYAIIKAILDSTNPLWTNEVALAALEAYKSLVPDNAVNIDTWYHAHSFAVYTAYRNEIVTGTTPMQTTAYFNWQRGASSPAFASDAGSSTAWNGLTDTTLNVKVIRNATTPDEAIV